MEDIIDLISEAFYFMFELSNGFHNKNILLLKMANLYSAKPKKGRKWLITINAIVIT